MLAFQVIVTIFGCIQAYNLDIHFPILYKDPAKKPSEKKSSYFGYSLVMNNQLTTNGSNFWIGVGAPKATVFGIKESGTFYKCLDNETCNEVQLETKGRQKPLQNGNHTYHEDKEFAWIGGAMDSGGNPATGGYTVVCGHRWMDKQTALDFLPGVCYWKSEVDKNYIKALPLANSSNCVHHSSAVTICQGNVENYLLLPPFEYVRTYPASLIQCDTFIWDDVEAYDSYILNNSTFKWGLGQAGAAVHIPRFQDHTQIVIGAPGVDSWEGSVLSYIEQSKENWKNNIAESRKSRKLQPFELYGYAVTSGMLSQPKQLLHAAGGPRGAHMKGHVLIYTFCKCKHRNYDLCQICVLEEVKGETIGEYFGAALSMADINGDGLDDLVVGAPMYSVNYCDQGKVHVFLATKIKGVSLFRKNILLYGKSIHGRFGTSVASIGDIDRDGYEDIAIGAPFENEHQGAIYIYHGSEYGLREERKIAAEEVNHNIVPMPHLRGFGISIAKAVDIDGNGFKDVAVGSFLSAHAVVFKAHKVVNISTEIIPAVNFLQTFEITFNVTACVSYSGTNAPVSIVVNRTFIVDKIYQRFYMKNHKTVYSGLITIQGVHQPMCENITLYAKNKQPVKKHDEILLELNIEEQDIKELSGNNFCSICPVINKFQSTMMANAIVNFYLNCGKDNKCQSKLEVSYILEGLIEDQTFLVGSEENPVLSINISNAGEPSYNTEVKVIIPSSLQLAVKPQHCQSEKSTHQLLCDVGNPLITGKPALIKIPLDMSEVVWMAEPLIFNFSLFYSNKSENVNTKYEIQQLKLNLKNDACVGLTGKSEESLSSNSTTDHLDFEHIYEVYKYGVSPMQGVHIYLSIPISWTEADGNTINFLDFEIQSFQSGSLLHCYINGMLVDQNEELSEGIEREQLDYIENHEEESISRMKRDITENKNQDQYSLLYVNRTLILNCSIPNVACSTVHCIVGAFPRGRQNTARVLLKMKLYVDKLGVLMKKRDIISVVTNASMTGAEQHTDACIDHPLFVQSVFPLQIKKAVLETWVICLSIIAGILIFMLLVIGLIKAGFFRRKKKEELMALKRESVAIMFIPGEINYTEDAEFMEMETNGQ